MVEEDSIVVVSSVDFEVVRQSGRTASSTVKTLQLGCCCCDRCCSAALFADSGKTLASLFFKLCRSFSGQAVPAGSFQVI